MVAALSEWIETNYAKDRDLSILVDNPEGGADNRPIAIAGHVPDVFARALAPPHKTIVGEAKTAWDLDTRRTEKQLKVFLEHCAGCGDSCFVLIVPWELVRYARSLVEDLKSKCRAEHVKTFVLEHF
jgi:hypothetical protein